MADEQPDFISQLRALNPDAGLEKYDDQTLASLVADQHPDYAPRLSKYLHPTADIASQALAQTGAQGVQGATPEWESSNPYLRGMSHVAQGLTSPTSLALIGGTAALAPVAPVAAATVGGAFVVKQAWDTLKSIPELYRLYKSEGFSDNFKEKATEAGLNGMLAGLGAYHAATAEPTVGTEESVFAPRAAKMVPDEAAQAAATTAGKVAEAVKDIPGASEAAEAQKSAQEAAAEQSQVPDQMRPEEPPADEEVPFIKKGTKLVQTSTGLVGPETGGTLVDPSKLADVSATGVKDMGGMLRVSLRSPTPITEAQIESMFPNQLVSAQKLVADPLFSAGQQVFHVSFYNRNGALDYAASKAAEWQLGGPFYDPRTGQKAVQTSSGPVLPNPEADPDMKAGLEEAIRMSGVDPRDPQQVMNLFQELYGTKKPMIVDSVGDVDVSDSSEAPDAYHANLADNDVTKEAHEFDHGRVQEGQIPEVPEGEGANNQIAGQVTRDLQAKYAGNINLNRLDIPANAKQAILDYSDQIQQTGPIPHEQTIADASAIGMNLEDAQKLAASTGDLHAQATAARTVMSGAAQAFADVRQAYMQNPTDPGLAAGARHGLNQLISTMQASSEVAANIGRALSSYNIGGEAGEPTLATQFGDLLTQLQKKGKLSQDLQDKIIKTDLADPVQQESLRTALQSKNATLMDKISYYYVNSILSGIPTAMKKLSSDVGIALMSPLETAAAGKPGAGVARLYGTFSGLDDAFQALTRSWKEGSPDYSPTVPIGGVAGTVIRTPVRTLGAITDFVRQMNVRGSLYEQGYEAARAQGASPIDAMKQAGEVAEAPNPDQLSAAQLDAKDRVLLSKPGDFGSGMYALRSSTPFGKIIAPVLQIPLKIAEYGTDLSPIGWAKMLRDVTQGKDISDVRMGRAVLGTALWTYTQYLVQSGKMTGEGPLDPVEFRKKYNTGWRPNSLLIDGKYIPIGWFGPIGFSMSMAATLAETLRDAPRAVDAAQAGVVTAAHMGRFILDQPYMQGLNNVVETLHDPGTAWRLLGQTAGGFIPSAVARPAAAMDPYDRQLRSFVDMVRARVPYLREEIPTKRDVEGDPLPAPGTPLGREIAPMGASIAQPLGVAQRAYQDSSVGANPGFITYNGKHLVLDEGDRDQYDQYVGAIVKKQFARINAAPSNFPTDPSAKQEIIKDIITGARQIGSLQMLKDLKDRGTLDAYMAAATGKQQAKKSPNPYSDILDVPGNAQAEDTLDRYQIPRQGMPSSIPGDLAPAYDRELKKAVGSYLYPAYANPGQFHTDNPSFESAKSKVQQLYDIATKHAADETLRQSGVKSPTEAPQ